ncbi:DEAD/DEAH box helicase [Flavobacterium sp. SM2513]|uniref:DEAD/DEAH box helicase n=1 Tax=Flavobacterium sp. SM2513 TaxID=3424766 RepID=UPI003D7F4D21
MKLKKINPNLQKALIENDLTEANVLQQETFSLIKSGADCVIIAPEKSGKTAAIVLNVIQRLEKEFQESPRALIFVHSKEKLIEMKQMFEKFGNYTNLRVYGVHDKGDIDFDKNHISLGIDVLIGTTNRLNDLFSTAGFDVNQLKMFIVENTDDLLKLRYDTKISRIGENIKTQRIFFSENESERLYTFVDRVMIEPTWFDFYDDGEEEEEDIDDDDEQEDGEEE